MNLLDCHPYSGQSCLYECKPGYTLSINTTLHCDPTGQWDVDPETVCTGTLYREREVNDCSPHYHTVQDRKENILLRKCRVHSLVLAAPGQNGFNFHLICVWESRVKNITIISFFNLNVTTSKGVNCILYWDFASNNIRWLNSCKDYCYDVKSSLPKKWICINNQKKKCKETQYIYIGY